MLIDREALYLKFKDTLDYYTALETMEIIDNAPIIDAVEVVFCKNCKHRETTRCITPELVNDDDYCSYGKRRESEASE